MFLSFLVKVFQVFAGGFATKQNAMIVYLELKLINV